MQFLYVFHAELGRGLTRLAPGMPTTVARGQGLAHVKL